MRTLLALSLFLFVFLPYNVIASNIYLAGFYIGQDGQLGYKSPDVGFFIKSESNFGKILLENSLNVNRTPKILYGKMLNIGFKSCLLYSIWDDSSYNILFGGGIAVKNQRFLDLHESYMSLVPSLELRIYLGERGQVRISETFILPGYNARYRSYGFTTEIAYQFSWPIRIGFEFGSVNLTRVSVPPQHFGWPGWYSAFVAYRFGR